MYAKDRTTIVDRRELLRVKVNSLAAEARIIRAAERKSWGPLREEMHSHRIKELRQEARLSALALGFIKGRTLTEMENKQGMGPSFTKAEMDRVDAMLKKYGPAGLSFSTVQLTGYSSESRERRSKLGIERHKLAQEARTRAIKEMRQRGKQAQAQEKEKVKA
jgi:hypothetical protein